MTPRSRHRLVSLACTALAATVLTGCGAVLDTDRADSAVASRSARPKQTAAPSPTTPDATEASASSASASPAEDALAETPTRSAAPRPTLPTRLLTAEELPGVTSSLGWTEERTARREPESLAGTCHRFAMLSIGATRVAHRDYVAADGSDGARADELVATFADTKTAWRAFEVLKSWHDDCGKVLGRWEKHDVGPLEEVAVDRGEAHTYLLTYGPADDQGASSYLDAEGIVKVGNRIAVLRIAFIGQGDDYADGKEPVSAAVKAAAAKLH